MSKQLFSKIVYDNYLFDIPRLMDLCMLYGVKDNVPLLKKMIENVFHNQPLFYDDLQQAAKTVSQVRRAPFLNFIALRCHWSRSSIPNL